jgi:triacylglycerol lipase
MSSRSFLPSALLSAGREALAFARQAWLLGQDDKEPRAEIRDGDDVVVLLHGLFATSSALRPMRRALGRHRGVHATAMSYPSGPGVEELAERLAALVAELPASTRLHLVGHSLGGVVARFYAQESADGRVAQTISMGSPFAGISFASHAPGLRAAHDLAPGSAILRKIRLAASASAHVPHLSIIAARDAFTRAPVSHALPGGEVIVLEGRGHNALLFDEEVAQIVERRILDGRRGR